jgi:hypothetical protein
MPAPPSRSSLFDPLSKALANTRFGELYDYVTGLLGATGNAAEARAALGASAVGDDVFTAANEAAARAAISALGATESAAGLVAGADLSGLTQFGKSLSSSGYQRLPGGLILQWGVTTTSASGVVNTTLAIAFPNVFLASVGNSRDTANNVIVQTNSASLTQIGVSAWNTSNVRVASTAFWFAVGY